MPKAIIIGAGFSGLSAAAKLAATGFDVSVLEKNDRPGGRARIFEANGFRFDMGPSWYWMPAVFSDFFADLGKDLNDYYQLCRLDPSYKVVLPQHEVWDIPAGINELKAFFESVEAGAGERLMAFLKEAQVKYELSMNGLVKKPALSWSEYMRMDVMTGMLKTKVFRSLRKHVASHFKDERLRMLMEFPVLFLGASPQNTPSLYSLMNYADMSLGTWYPQGGMGSVVNAFVQLAEDFGARFNYEQAVSSIETKAGQVIGVVANDRFIEGDVVIATADYQHVEQVLLPKDDRDYSKAYWEKRSMAPSSLLFYLGIAGTIPHIDHHTLFFDESLDAHSHAIYEKPRWPEKPLFYANCTSKTDKTVAPSGHETLFLLVPIAAGLQDDENTREKYFELLMQRLEEHCGVDLRPKVVYKRSYCVNDFKHDYNAFKGNAYGLANTLRQTAVLRPRMKSKTVSGLYYAGQLTVPGPGVPPAIISGQVVAELVTKDLKKMAV